MDIEQEYQEHLVQGACTTTPEDGCTICYKAQETGLIPDNDYNEEQVADNVREWAYHNE